MTARLIPSVEGLRLTETFPDAQAIDLGVAAEDFLVGADCLVGLNDTFCVVWCRTLVPPAAPMESSSRARRAPGSRSAQILQRSGFDIRSPCRTWSIVTRRSAKPCIG